VSPLLANIYLHEVFDRWFEDEVRPRMRGRVYVVRFADDIMIAFDSELEARRVMEVLEKRLARFGLRLNPQKTQLVEFHEPRRSQERLGPRQGSFDLLGFTHHWGRSREGRWVIKRRTAGDRLRRAARAIGQWCRAHRHMPIAVQHQLLTAKLEGHDAYYGITGNWFMLRRLRWIVERGWKRWLSRRSQRGMTWEQFYRVLERYPLPKPRIVHRV
jgi:hypothetical protein